MLKIILNPHNTKLQLTVAVTLPVTNHSPKGLGTRQTKHEQRCPSSVAHQHQRWQELGYQCGKLGRIDSWVLRGSGRRRTTERTTPPTARRTASAGRTAAASPSQESTLQSSWGLCSLLEGRWHILCVTDKRGCCTKYSNVAQYRTALFCIVLYCTVLYCTVLYCTVDKSRLLAAVPDPAVSSLYSGQ